MRRRRRSQPQVDPDFVAMIAGLYYTYEGNLERCRRLGDRRRAGTLTPELQRDALAGAREIAYVSRVAFEATMHLGFMDAVPDFYLPAGLFGALARLAYALTALAEPESEPEAHLSPDELNGLTAQYDLAEWVEHCRSLNPALQPGAQ